MTQAISDDKKNGRATTLINLDGAALTDSTHTKSFEAMYKQWVTSCPQLKMLHLRDHELSDSSISMLREIIAPADERDSSARVDFPHLELIDVLQIEK